MNFKLFTTQELIEYMKNFNWIRRPSEFHIHHTANPNHRDYNGNNGLQLQQNMKSAHMNGNGWSDIGQHLTLLPDGRWVTGRNFNINPASIYGRNHLGLAIEMLGNFTKGTDKLEGKQLQAIIEFLSFGLKFFGLGYEKGIVFHREHNATACPGDSLDKNIFIQQVINYDKNKTKKKDYDDSPFKESIEFVKKMGIMNGYSDEIFKPDETITNERMAAVLHRFYRIVNK